MALTMTRTRTQTALNKLAELIANVHGELETVEGLLAAARAEVQAVAEGGSAFRVELAEQRRAALDRRRQVLLAHRDSLYATVRQFNAELDPTNIGSAQGWLKQYGRGGGQAATVRYVSSLPR